MKLLISGACVVAVALLTGCTATGHPSATVQFVPQSGSAAETVDIDLAGLRCSVSDSLASFSTAQAPDDEPVFAATVLGDSAYTVSALLGDDLIFLSLEEFDYSAEGVSLTDHPGTVSRLEGGSPVEILDPEATLSANISC